MIILSIVGLGAFLVACTIVGIRLLLLWRRTRELPELAIGLAFLLGGALGYVPVVIATAVPDLPDRIATATFATGILALDVGAGALWLFTWRVFHPADPWAKRLFIAAIVLLLGTFVGQVATGGFSGTAYVHSLWYWAGFLTRASAFAWAAVESLRYHSALRKRARLGLAARSDVDVFLAWGVATTSAFLIFVLTALGIAMGDRELPVLVRVAQSFAGLVAAGSIWLTFFPPALYTQFVRSGRAPEESTRDA